jgi:hypothetical protein
MKVNQVGQFAFGIFISLVLSAVAVPLGSVAAIFFPAHGASGRDGGRQAAPGA